MHRCLGQSKAVVTMQLLHANDRTVSQVCRIYRGVNVVVGGDDTSKGVIYLSGSMCRVVVGPRQLGLLDLSGVNIVAGRR
jgi:hypothetical protein